MFRRSTFISSALFSYSPLLLKKSSTKVQQKQRSSSNKSKLNAAAKTKSRSSSTQQQQEQQQHELEPTDNNPEFENENIESKSIVNKHHQPDILIVQLCDHMQHDQGVKRHAVTITFGSDGFQLSRMCRSVRRDLRGLLAASYWQMHQTQERSAFFVCTRISHGTADLLLTSMTQRVVEHVEKSFRYRLASSYVTLSPDVQHTSVRMLFHYFIFRKVKNSPQRQNQKNSIRDCHDEEIDSREIGRGENDGEESDDSDSDSDSDSDDDNEEAEDGYDAAHRRGLPEYRNFEAPQVGPQEPSLPPRRVREDQAVKKIWPEE